jgi:hypothetical protein
VEDLLPEVDFKKEQCRRNPYVCMYDKQILRC